MCETVGTCLRGELLLDSGSIGNCSFLDDSENCWRFDGSCMADEATSVLEAAAHLAVRVRAADTQRCPADLSSGPD